ncbi:MAG: aminoacetone oxidase family FAD-binding enzyme [Atopobiaceae bacterium]|nr:aminoacetone oxidase family FAD-binding enzyme [Atopobiaceae bacterium]
MAQRAQQRARQEEAARQVAVPSETDVCVVGGGAAGLVAAITAAEKGARVVVLERNLECGHTILATGNGRCNFANAALDPARYNAPDFVRSVAGPSWLADVLGFFGDCGLAWEEEAEGRLYPLSRQASSVRNVLLARAARAGVTLAGGRNVAGAQRQPNGFAVRYEEVFGKPTRGKCPSCTIQAHALVLAAGGGTKLLENFDIPVSPFEPVLCPLACEGPLLKELDGRRVRVEARLMRHGAEVFRERGEVLFRPYGLSGIVVFNLSRFAQAGDELLLDLLPGMTLDEARRVSHLNASSNRGSQRLTNIERDNVRRKGRQNGLRNQQEQHRSKGTRNAWRVATTTLDGLLDPVIAQALLSHERDDDAALSRAKALRFHVMGPAEANRAQVTRGGFATDAFAAATLEAYAVPGLFACGEALDVDGPCGGFNLAWAWKSGMVAGAAAIGTCGAPAAEVPAPSVPEASVAEVLVAKAAATKRGGRRSHAT